MMKSLYLLYFAVSSMKIITFPMKQDQTRNHAFCKSVLHDLLGLETLHTSIGSILLLYGANYLLSKCKSKVKAYLFKIR